MASNGKSPAMPETGTVVKKTPFEIMLGAMANDAEMGTDDYKGDDLNAMLEADTMEDLWESDNRPPLNFQHIAGCEIQILDFAVKYSRGGTDYDTIFQKDGKKMYVLAKCVRISGATSKGNLIKLPGIGQEFMANTSARYVVTKLWRAMTLGELDVNQGKSLECMVEETDLGDGASVIKLRPIPKRSVSA